MEEKIKLIIKKLEDLKQKQGLDERNSKEEEIKNNATIEDLKKQNQRLASMRDVFEEEEEEYQEIHAEIVENESRIESLENDNRKLINKGTEIREQKGYKREIEEIEKLKEEARKELKDEQKFLIKNRKITQSEIEEKTAQISKEQNRLEADIEAIKRGIEKGFFLADGPEVLKEQQDRLVELEAKYGENRIELRRLSEVKNLKEDEIYAKIDELAEKVVELDGLTLENTKVNIELFKEEEIAKEEPAITPEELEKDRRKLAAQRVLENQYRIVKGDILYDKVMEAMESNIEIGDFSEFAKKELEELKRLNEQEATRGTLNEKIEKLEKEIQIAGVTDMEKASELSKKEVDETIKNTKNEMKKEEIEKRREEEARRKAKEVKEAQEKLKEERNRIKLASRRVLKDEYGIVEGDILYNKVMEAIDANIPIGSLEDFAYQILEEFEKANIREATKGKFDKDIETLRAEMEKAAVKSLANGESEISGLSQQEVDKIVENTKREMKKEEANKKKLEEERQKVQEEANKKKMQEADRKKKQEEKVKMNKEMEQFYNDNILSRGVKLAKVPRIQNSIRREIESGNKITNFEQFVEQKLVDIVKMDKQKNGRYHQIVKEFMKEMKALGIEYDKDKMKKVKEQEKIEEKVSSHTTENKQELLLTNLRIGKTVEITTKEKDGIYSKQNGFKSKVQKDKNDIFDKDFMYEAILDTKLYKDLAISKGLQERLNPIVVKTLMRIDEEFTTNGKYLKEYIKCMATRGKSPMSFNIEHDLQEINGGIIRQILNKLKPNKDKTAKRQNSTIIETIQKYAMQSKYFGKNFSVKGKYNIFSKNKPNKKMQALPPVIEEEKLANESQADFKKNIKVHNISGKDVTRISSPIIKEAKFETKALAQEKDKDLDDDFEIIDID